MTQLAIQQSISDVIEEYQTKFNNIPYAVEEHKKARTALEMASTVRGTYAHSIWDRSYGPSESTLKRNLLISAWNHVYKGLNIDKIAPVDDRKKIERKLENPPEFTKPNIREMFGDYIIDPRGHILRGLVEIFCKLDDSYKSHSKVKIGVDGLPKRIIINNVMNNFYGHGEERLKNLIDALRTYRGEGMMEYPEFRKITSTLDRREETSYGGMRFKPYMNGNCHVYFDEHTLKEVNRALADFYGDVLPDMATEKPTERAKSTAVSKDLQYYPTPNAVIDRMLSDVYIREGEKVLEPSCGCGRILDVLASKGVDTFGIEVDPSRAQEARSKGHSVYTANFLEVPAEEEYDFVIMNPPFYGQHYLSHLEHAMKFLKPGGLLVSVLPASAWYDHKKVQKMKGYVTWRDLPLSSFKESGTNVNTGYVTIRKNR